MIPDRWPPLPPSVASAAPHVIFASSSPLRNFLNSPATRRAAQYQRQVEQIYQQNRHLRTQLETEKTEKQFAPDEGGEAGEGQEVGGGRGDEGEAGDEGAVEEVGQRLVAESELQAKFHTTPGTSGTCSTRTWPTCSCRSASSASSSTSARATAAAA